MTGYSIYRDGKEIILTKSEMNDIFLAVRDSDDMDYIRGNIRPHEYGFTDEEFENALPDIVDAYHDLIPYYTDEMAAVVEAIESVRDEMDMDDEEEDE